MIKPSKIWIQDVLLGSKRTWQITPHLFPVDTWLRHMHKKQFQSVQFSHSVMSDSLWPPWTVACQASLSITNSWSLFKLMSKKKKRKKKKNHVHWVGDAIQPSHPLSSPSPPAFSLSQHHGLFKWVSSLHQVTKVLEFQLQHQFFKEYLGLISFRMDWLDLLAVQGTLKSLPQHHSSKVSIIWHSAAPARP